MEVKTIEAENKVESAQRATRVLIRSAKAANLLFSLKNRLLDSTIKLTQQEEEKKLRRENEELRMKLLLERVKNRKIKLLKLTEFLLMIVVCFSFWLFCLFVLFGLF